MHQFSSNEKQCVLHFKLSIAFFSSFFLVGEVMTLKNWLRNYNLEAWKYCVMNTPNIK